MFCGGPISLEERTSGFPELEIGFAEDEGTDKNVNEAGVAARDDGAGAGAGSGDVRRHLIGGGSDSVRDDDKHGLAKSCLQRMVSVGGTCSWAAGCDDAIVKSLSRKEGDGPCWTGRRRLLLAFITGERGITFPRGSADVWRLGEYFVIDMRLAP